jgi:hypothetical protein
MSDVYKTGSMSAVISKNGLNQLETALRDLNITDAESINILQTIAAPIVTDLQTSAPNKTGATMRSIRVYRQAKSPYRKIQIGPMYVKGGGPDAGNAAHLSEFGTAERTQKKGLRAGGITQKTMEPFKGPNFFRPYAGKPLGRVQAKQWILNVYKRQQSAAQSTGNQMLLAAIDKKAKQQGFKTK